MLDESQKELSPFAHPQSMDEESLVVGLSSVVPSSVVKEDKRKCCLCRERLASIKELFVQIKELFLQTYRNPEYPEEFKSVQNLIQKKTWLMHSMVVVGHSILSIVGSDLW